MNPSFDTVVRALHRAANEEILARLRKDFTEETVTSEEISLSDIRTASDYQAILQMAIDDVKAKLAGSYPTNCYFKQLRDVKDPLAADRGRIVVVCQKLSQSL